MKKDWQMDMLAVNSCQEPHAHEDACLAVLCGDISEEMCIIKLGLGIIPGTRIWIQNVQL